MKKVVFVTGASAGIGKATALFLAENGYIVYGAARLIQLALPHMRKQKWGKTVAVFPLVVIRQADGQSHYESNQITVSNVKHVPA